MDRVAVFVDAGYLLGEGGALVLGSRRRADVDCAYGELAQELAAYVSGDCGQPLLRIYWYDAARFRVPQRQHAEIASLPNVKLRLGRLSHEGQKGVDSLIIRDLMTLARERAMATAYVVAGDEDLREGIAEAQDMGVRVVVVGIAGDEVSLSEALVHEADETRLFDRGFLERFLRPAEGPQARVADGSDEVLARPTGAELAREYATSVPRDELEALLTSYPSIPSEVDRRLLHGAQRALGDLRDRFDLKVELRAGFWDGVSEAVAAGRIGSD